MNPTNHQSLFRAVASLPDRGLVQPCRQELDDFTVGLLGQFGRKSPLRTTFVLHTGRRLANECAGVVAELAADIGLGVIDPWRSQWREITRVLRRFFLHGPDDPAMLWTHTLCWSDRAVQRAAGADITRPRSRVRRVVPDMRVRLFFEARRWATIDTSHFRWLSPVPQVSGEFDLAKVVETRETVWRGRVISLGHREAFGACGDLRTDRRWLARSLFPGLQGRVYALGVGRDGKRTGLLTPTTVAGENRPLPDEGRVERVLDDLGILDTHIVKAWRLSEVAVMPGVRDTMVDELAFVLTRFGEVAYIAATWDRLDRYVPTYGEDNWLGEWLAARD